MDRSARRKVVYRLIAIDLDGTLLDDNKNIPKDNIDVINELMDLGYEIVFATGRRYMAARDFIDEFKEDILIFANNGNIIRHSSDDRLEVAHYLQSDTIEEVLDYGRKLNLHPVLHIDRFDEGIDMLVEKSYDDPAYSGYLDGEDRYESVGSFSQEDLSRILSIVYIGRIDELSQLKDYTDKNYADDYTTYLMTNVHLAEGLLEICNPDISKWVSIENYASYKGIKPEEIIAIGDDTNDMEMIEKAGLGIAMRNAVDSVKDVADLVTYNDNNDAGLAQVLRGIFKIWELD